MAFGCSLFVCLAQEGRQGKIWSTVCAYMFVQMQMEPMDAKGKGGERMIFGEASGEVLLLLLLGLAYGFGGDGVGAVHNW